MIDVARECGYLDGLPEFRRADSWKSIPRDKVVALLTPARRASPARPCPRSLPRDHPDISLAEGDRVIFSSRAIPGNERDVGAIINDLIEQGVEVINTDRTALVHVSGHPRRDEMVEMYKWTRPQTAIPVHGEALHLDEHARFARAQGVGHVVKARNGAMVRLAPGKPEVVEHVQGRAPLQGRPRPDRRQGPGDPRAAQADAGGPRLGGHRHRRRRRGAGQPAVDIIGGLPNRGRGGEA